MFATTAAQSSHRSSLTRHIVAWARRWSRCAIDRSRPGERLSANPRGDALDRRRVRLDVGGLVRPEHVVGLEEVDAPRRVQLDRRVVVRLSRRVASGRARACRDSTRRRSPGSATSPPSHRCRGSASALGNRAARDATHRVDAELEAHGVEALGERARIRRRRPSSGSAPASGMSRPCSIHRERRFSVVAVRAGRRIRPVDVDHDRVPARAAAARARAISALASTSASVTVVP